MRKKMFTLIVASFAMLGFQALGQELKQSMVIDFEPDNFVETDINYGWGTCTYVLTANTWAEEDWDGAGAPADPINSSATCLQVDVSGTNIYDGPNVVFPHPVTISAMDSSTWFFHIQMLLPEFQTKGGTFQMNMFNSINSDRSKGASDYIWDTKGTGSIKYPTDYNAIDRPRQCWVELDFDMRLYMGVTFYSVQIEGQRNTGAETWYCDNICFDNRQKAFGDIDLGTPKTLTVADEGTQYLVFYAGTSYCLTAQATPPTGYASTSFSKFDPESYADDSETNFQVWNVKPSTIADDRQYFTLDYDYGYLSNNGSIRSFDETKNAMFSWFLTQKEAYDKAQSFRLLSAFGWKYIAPGDIMEDLELAASSDSTAQWTFVANNQTAIDTYLASAKADSIVKLQVPNGDYYIFYAGTNYCMTDTRPMVWSKATRTLEDGVTTQTDSMYIPGVSFNSPTNTDTRSVYNLVLNEFAATENQQWQVQYYSDFVDLNQTHTYWKRVGNRLVKDAFGFNPLITERMYWGYDDSTTRAVGNRLITSKPYDLNWTDMYGEAQVLPNYISIFGDNATIINDDNNEQWFVKRIPINKDGISAIYRPNNGIQGTGLKAKYAGGALYATPNADTGKASEMNYYCWKFVDINSPVVATVAASQALIVKDTVFGYPKLAAPGDYYIQYRGTNQVLTYTPKVDDNPLTLDVDESKPATAVVSSLSADAGVKAATQVWTVADAGNDLFTLSTADDKQIYTPAAVGKALVYGEDEAASASLADKYKQLQGLFNGTNDMGQYGAWTLNADQTSRKFFDLQQQIAGAALYTTATPSDYPFVFVKVEDPIIPGLPLPDTTLVAEGYYYIQYAFAADSFDVFKTYVLAPDSNISAPAVTLLEPYDATKAWQKWYIAPIAYDTTQFAAGLAPGFCNYAIFASASVKDSLDAGMSVLDIFRDPTYNADGYRVLDDNGKTNNDVIGTNYGWWSFKFYDKGGKIALRNAKNASFQSFTVDHIPSLVGGATNSNNYGDGATANFNEPRTFCWYLIPATETPAFIPVSNYASWNPIITETEKVVADAATVAENVTVDGNIITITNAEGASILVVSVDGTVIASVASAKEVQTIAVKATGIYVVKVGNVAVKVAVK